ncbi:MAG: thioredoxin-dependent thiol peroxidase [Proteobacteria bacterium]|nr:thioredoxin-dependent thiol peroxidase [Pseudomonadota bacterium]
MSKLKIGSKAPSFALPDQTGAQRTLKDVAAEYTVLYFYPKDDTPGCTLEAREFSQHAAAFKKLGAQIVGVSGGDARSKEKFCEKYGLRVMLLADTDFAVAKKFGVYGKKKFMGREYMGILRQTFVLDNAGKLIKQFPEVSPQGHAEEVLEFLRSGRRGGPSIATARRETTRPTTTKKRVARKMPKKRTSPSATRKRG